ncbi:coiled-coil domain-containing protein 137 [Pseudomyrmex gracilis]|uniref:coiled-coil domain-containing protein 137 n=1 Tax=Pseudomyrmex gracilis TaxID=219809 RepID=UPI00099517CC|nr:coiled-coil domain-containing protein 137 [Pseudomyrmex gracilis]
MVRHKIPAKKHRGVKDPGKQRAKRLAELATCTNTAPKDINEQEIPKSLERVIKLKEIAKNSSILKKKRKKKKNALICVGQQQPKAMHPKAKPEKVVPVFQQLPGESGQKFMHRVCKDTHSFLKETQFERKYNVQIERDPESGEIQGLKKCKREDIDIEMLQAKHKNIKKKKKTIEGPKPLTKKEKQRLKLNMKKQKQLEDDEFKMIEDKVAFGEVAHEPPKLKIKSKDINEGRKPKGLLLHSLLEDAKTVSSNSRVIDRSGKRKNLPVAERRKLEKQQSEAIASYRKLRSQQSVNKS